MDIAQKIAQYISDAGYGDMGDDVFVGQIPSGTDGVYVVRTSGELNKYDSIETTVLDIYIKDTSSSTAVTTLESIKRSLHRSYGISGTDFYIYSILVIGDVEDVDRDLEYAKLYKITVSVMHRATALIS